MIAFIPKAQIDHTGEVPLSLIDWKTRASKRVLHATFAAEAQAAKDAHGLGVYVRAFYLDILLGFADWLQVDEFREDQMQIIVCTDAKSLFDHLKKEGTVPED